MSDEAKERKTTEVPIPQSSHWGIVEHFCRAGMFFNAGVRTPDPGAAYRILLAALYSCRAVAELMLEEASPPRDELTIDRKSLDKLLEERLPYYKLIERIRIHDFHRYGIMPPNPNVKSMIFRGPMTAQCEAGGPGSATVQFTGAGPQITCTGTGKVKEQRSLLSCDGHFFDPETKVYVSLAKIIRDYLTALPPVIQDFEGLYKGGKGHLPYQGEEESEDDQAAEKPLPHLS